MNKESERVTSQKEALLTAIRESEVFREFEQAKERIAGREEELHRLNQFRKKSYLLSNTSQPIDVLGEMNQLQKERQALRENGLIADYLTAEQNLCRMLQRICFEVLSLTDLQIDEFLDSIEVS